MLWRYFVYVISHCNRWTFSEGDYVDNLGGPDCISWKDLKSGLTEVSLFREKKFCSWMTALACAHGVSFYSWCFRPDGLAYGFLACWFSPHKCKSIFCNKLSIYLSSIIHLSAYLSSISHWFFFSNWTLTDTDFDTRSGSRRTGAWVLWIGTRQSMEWYSKRITQIIAIVCPWSYTTTSERLKYFIQGH